MPLASCGPVCPFTGCGILPGPSSSSPTPIGHQPFTFFLQVTSHLSLALKVKASFTPAGNHENEVTSHEKQWWVQPPRHTGRQWGQPGCSPSAGQPGACHPPCAPSPDGPAHSLHSLPRDLQQQFPHACSLPAASQDLSRHSLITVSRSVVPDSL